jgi:hypothetical protein
MCCKLLGIAEIDKPINAWCPHCARGTGCTIYEQRPQACRAFACGWLLDPAMPETWRPDRSKLVVMPDEDPEQIVILVDPGTPDAWRREPFHSELRRRAAQALRAGGNLIVVVNGKATLVLAEAEQFLGAVQSGDKVAVTQVPEPGGVRLDVRIFRQTP